MLDRLPNTMAAMERFWLPSLRTKHTNRLLNINMGANIMRIRRYTEVFSNTWLSAPRAADSGVAKRIPPAENNREITRSTHATWVKIVRFFPSSARPPAMAKAVAPPMPVISPRPLIKLYTGIARFKAASPSAPAPAATK